METADSRPYEVTRTSHADAVMREIVSARELSIGTHAAKKLIDAFEGAFQQLAVFPMMGRAAEDTVLRANGYGKLQVAEYLILYSVDPSLKGSPSPMCTINARALRGWYR